MLTDAHCRNAKPQESLYRLRDGRGLYLEVKPNGVKAWRYRFKLQGKESMFALGEYPMIPLSEARQKCEDARRLVKQGLSPTQNRRSEKLNTLERIAREWVSKKNWEKITRDRRINMLERVVFPYIGSMPIRAITSPQILEILLRAKEKNGPSVSAEAKRTLFGIFELATETYLVDSNPVRQWREALPPNKTQHKQALSVEQVGKLLADFDGHGGSFQTKQAFKLMWLTLSRPNESVQAEWEEFDLDTAVWKIPARRMKARREHVVPLPTQAVSLLRAMQPITGTSKYVFPNRDDRARPMADAALRSALKALGWATKFSPHGTRTTGSTRLNELGFRFDVIEAQLAHIEPNSVRRTYNHASYFEERRGMMQKWADLLDEWRAQ